jgi:glucosamine 6-phosphate synthetase-like amidotransferase/phosphosugar isomerase protein
MSPEQAMGKAMERLRGAFALAILFSGRHDTLMGARRGSSLAVGYGDGEMYIGTDALALAPFTAPGQLPRGRRLGRAARRWAHGLPGAGR